MTTEQMRELKIWIQINVFGFKHSVEKEYPNRCGFSKDGEFILECDLPDYPNDPAAAMEVLKKCAEHLASKTEISINMVCSKRFPKCTDVWVCGAELEYGAKHAAPTLELAICLFAKKLFTK